MAASARHARPASRPEVDVDSGRAQARGVGREASGDHPADEVGLRGGHSSCEAVACWTSAEGLAGCQADKGAEADFLAMIGLHPEFVRNALEDDAPVHMTSITAAVSTEAMSSLETRISASRYS